MVYVVSIIAVLVILIFVVGIFLPAERVVTRKGHFDVSPEVLYGIVTDNTDWRYRQNLKDLVILESNDGMEVWDEIGHDGSTVRFTTREKRPSSFYSFHMDSKLFYGYWTGEFEAADMGGTIFTATEHISVKNIFVKTLSYLFFDIGKLMDSYHNDLTKKINSR